MLDPGALVALIAGVVVEGGRGAMGAGAMLGYELMLRVCHFVSVSVSTRRPSRSELLEAAHRRDDQDWAEVRLGLGADGAGGPPLTLGTQADCYECGPGETLWP